MVKMIHIDKPVEEISTLLKNRSKPLRMISAGSGVSFHWLATFSQGRIPNPGVRNLQKLADYFNKYGA